MKREEKNLQSRQKIMESALHEFAAQGYGSSSINTICEAGKISKGVLYHYFKDKDEVYLTCVEACFHALTAHLSEQATREGESAQDKLESYFDARRSFFAEHPLYRRLFFEAVMAPPAHLAAAISERKVEFDTLNQRVFSALLECVELRPDMSRQEVIETFRQYQDFVNATAPVDDAEAHEQRCRRAVRVLLYGVAARGEREV